MGAFWYNNYSLSNAMYFSLFWWNIVFWLWLLVHIIRETLYFVYGLFVIRRRMYIEEYMKHGILFMSSPKKCKHFMVNQ